MGEGDVSVTGPGVSVGRGQISTGPPGSGYVLSTQLPTQRTATEGMAGGHATGPTATGPTASDPAASDPAESPASNAPMRVLLMAPQSHAARQLVDVLTDAAIAVDVVEEESTPAVCFHEPSPERDVAVIAGGSDDAMTQSVVAARAAGWSRVLVLAPATDPASAVEALASGATGALIPSRSARRSGAVPSGIFELSAREVEVLRMVADGRSNKWIGDRLKLSALTVKSHLARIGRKLGTGERAHMVMLALRAGVIS